MLDFLKVAHRRTKNGIIEIYPIFVIKEGITDLMVRGRDFYAIWDERSGFWSTNENDAVRLIDTELDIYAEEHKDKFESGINISYVKYGDTGNIDKFHKYCQKQLRDSYVSLDEKLTFADTEVKKEDYVSKKLSYPLTVCDITSYEKLISTLYSTEERHKIEWAIGSIISGDSKKIQKFLVLYGASGTGKSTILNIIQQLFEGYYCVFDAKALGSASASFALEAFNTNPLVAIQHDGDLSRIEDNTRLNSLVSHETMTVNEKHKSIYSNKFNSFLFMGTNKPVKITDAKSGLIRRLIDVTPTGKLLSYSEYKKLMKDISFELGGIATHCLEVYKENPDYYESYIPNNMMGASNDFYNFVFDSYYIFKEKDGVSLNVAWEMYLNYCEDCKLQYPLNKRIFKEELKNYFEKFEERVTLDDGTRIRSYYSEFKSKIFDGDEDETPSTPLVDTIIFKEQRSLLDEMLADCPAQYANCDGIPSCKWSNVTTTLKDLDTSKLHYVQPPTNYIFLDFDIPDENGNKSFELNLAEAIKWPKTYAELSKSGEGIHLHYIYVGDVSELKNRISEHIEIKVCTGNFSIRRKLSKCSNDPIAIISSGLPKKEVKKVVNMDRHVKSEAELIKLIRSIMRKEGDIPSTVSGMSLIVQILNEAYNATGSDYFIYDVSSLEDDIYAFASHSTHHPDQCISMIDQMHFQSRNYEGLPIINNSNDLDDDSTLHFFDVEVYPNLFLFCYKKYGEGNPVIRLYNPSAEVIEELFKKCRFLGYNNRRYDNHICYAVMLGYNNIQVFNLSSRITSNDPTAYFGNAWNISKSDVYDMLHKKQSLKKWEIDLKFPHKEMDIPWDKPAPKELWDVIGDYCENDVLATEAVFNHCKGDWIARKILADISGGTVNDTTNTLTAKLIFGKEKHPELVYTDLATGKMSDGGCSEFINSFPGYALMPITKEIKDGKTRTTWHNMYKGEDVGFGGLAQGFPGIYGGVIYLDVMSMHPHSACALRYFGKRTKKFKELLDARILIKHKDFEAASKLFDGKLAKWLVDESMAKDLSQALKIAINSVYGLTAASFDNPFRDKRNTNNIIALRGALFMVDLKHEVQNRGFKVCHIKTDSIKIADANPEIIAFCMEFAKKYGYTFEIEDEYERMCIINNADLIAKRKDGSWVAVGARFSHPFVFKTLFTHEDIIFDDLCETKSVTGDSALYLDICEDLPEGEHNYHFVGKVGSFIPVIPGCGGGKLQRYKDGKYYNATGTTGYLWMEAEDVKGRHLEEYIDYSYYDNLANEAEKLIISYGDTNWFLSDEPYVPPKYVDGHPVYDEPITF